MEVEIEVVSPSIVSSGEVSLSLNRTVTCMVLKANDRRTSCPCHDEFRGPRSDYVRQDSLRQGGTLNFLICTDSLSTLHCLLNVNSTEKLVVEVQSILYYLDCGIHFSYVRGHSGNLGSDRADQLAKEATCQDMNLLMSVPLSHWEHLAWERTVSSWNTEFLASPKALWTKKVFSDHLSTA
ncbi:RNase H domain-containing protein [Trichonephila clavipes]|nr:RNase H domain-containing protein [Trichonephila clavipes]